MAVKDNELKKGTIYWVEVIDPELKSIYMKKSKMIYSGVFFRSIKNNSFTLFLSQIAVIEEIFTN